jgi:anti-sigma B factor antagonist
MDLSTETTDAGLVIRVLDTRIDAAGAIEFKEAVRMAAQAPGSPVILDLSQVTFIDSSGLGAVVAVLKLLGPQRPLHLAAPQPNVAKVFRLTRMDSVFTIHDTVPTSLRAAG